MIYRQMSRFGEQRRPALFVTPRTSSPLDCSGQSWVLWVIRALVHIWSETLAVDMTGFCVVPEVGLLEGQRFFLISR